MMRQNIFLKGFLMMEELIGQDQISRYEISSGLLQGRIRVQNQLSIIAK